jgi:hypothetical protein
MACTGMGVFLELNSFGELYVLLMMRLPGAVLAAAFIVSAGRRLAAWRRQAQAENAGVALPASPWIRPRMGWSRAIAAGVGVAVLVGGIGIQTSLWWSRNSNGLREFLKTPADLKPDESMRELQEALLWVRHHTEPDAVLVANSCTPENMKKDHWGALDRTLTGVHFYYSAISERRLWFEGPSYILDTTRARIRASLASNFFYRGATLNSEVVSADPAYVLLDRSLADGAVVTLPLGHRVFANRRMEVYRLAVEKPVIGGLNGAQIAGGLLQ